MKPMSNTGSAKGGPVKSGQPSGASAGIPTSSPNLPAAPVATVEDLSEQEHSTLAECEQTIGRGWTTFVEVGQALAKIRDERLYRGTHPTFEAYCRDRWDYGRAYANRLIGAAEVVAHLVTIGTNWKPANEAQVRPLIGLPSAQLEQTCRTAEQTAGGKPLTAKLVARAAAEFKPARKARPGISSEPRTPSSDSPVLAEIADQLGRMRAAVEQGCSPNQILGLIDGVVQMVESLRNTSASSW